ncbi:hypothetical protein EIN_502380 [Entamoeba invadens IP1]|uniref:VWFA domain-containing protein n=1 Tax=Entamoeba invadens IP1 TaxID=370355 RepID=A0A0A1TUZ5_ENTIV|nr:hypothetical protein EIN_502380 [Entamoeba invadens IP1]ELP84105.1 hypothetical protein EIN_502380 [Entamoeba invadens IP1]|eukprot:XP_004183451.1 hypothetical protein EIN_502380 [Entamoeba invadens IP1]
MECAASKADFCSFSYSPNGAPKVDTNIISANFSTLQTEIEPLQSEPPKCPSCGSYFTVNSFKEDGNIICPFCNSITHISSPKDSYISEETVELVLSPPELQKLEKVEEESEKVIDNKTIVFCIDVSGSMGSQPTDKNGKTMNGTSVLEVIKSAMIHQIKAMLNENPQQKVCIVTFDSVVTILGDCTKTPITVNHHFMNDFDSLVDVATEKIELTTLETSSEKILSALKALSPGSCTALGPALLVSTVAAGKQNNGSVILCTDGLANEGLGSSGSQNEKLFYQHVSEVARKNGVIINVNTVKGCDANMKVIGECAVLTDGQVMVVDPENITEAFKGALDSELIARQIVLDIFLPQSLYVKDEFSNEKVSKKSVDVGNALDDTTYQFKYAKRNSEDKLETFTVQLGIKYTKKNGGVYYRIITRKIEVAKEDEKVDLNGEVLQTYYIQQTAEHKRRGSIERAKENIGMFRQAQQVSKQVMQSEYNTYADDMENRLEEDNDEAWAVNQTATKWSKKKAKKFSEK